MSYRQCWNRPDSVLVNNRYECQRLQMLAKGVSGTVLDVGFADWPNPYFPVGVRVTGVDLVDAPAAPGYDRQVVGDFASTPELNEASFDFVIAGEVLEHVEDPYAFLRTCWRLLKPGGRLRLSTPNPLGFPALFMELTMSERRFFADDHTFYFSPRWVRKMLRSVGFATVTADGVGLWVPGLPALWCPTVLSYQVIYDARRTS